MNLNETDLKVLRSLKRGEKPVPASEIASRFRMDIRDIYTSIERLRISGVPIVANRYTGNSGLFIANDEEEKARGLAAYQGQMAKMAQCVYAVISSNTATWGYDLIDEERKEKEGALLVLGGKVYRVDPKMNGNHLELSISEEAITALTELA